MPGRADLDGGAGAPRATAGLLSAAQREAGDAAAAALARGLARLSRAPPRRLALARFGGPRRGLSTRTAAKGHGNWNKTVTFRPQDTAPRDTKALERPSTRLPPMRILVTGGAGFIGSNFVRFWLERHPPDPVVVPDPLPYPRNPHSPQVVRARIPFSQGAPTAPT